VYGSFGSLLDRIDFRQIGAQEIRASILDETSQPSAKGDEDFEPRSTFLSTICSPRFQRRAPYLFLSAFAELRRVVFVHLPKCAGTDLIVNLRTRFLSVPNTLTQSEWYPTDKLLRTLGAMALLARHANGLFFSGHFAIEELHRELKFRPWDNYITVVRDPIDQMISQANYIATVLALDPSRERPDSRNWASMLGNHTIPKDLRGDEGAKLAERILHDPQLTPPNPLTALLGSGLQNALDNLARFDFEITDVIRYERWLARRWGVAKSSRLNASIPFLRRDRAGKFVHYLEEVNADDLHLYEKIRSALDNAEYPSIRARALQ
jgi:hypothetical protein